MEKLREGLENREGLEKVTVPAFLCGNLEAKKSFFELKQRLIVARVR